MLNIIQILVSLIETDATADITQSQARHVPCHNRLLVPGVDRRESCSPAVHTRAHNRVGITADYDHDFDFTLASHETHAKRIATYGKIPTSQQADNAERPII